MDWDTLIAVVIGGLIAIIPTIITNRFQAKEREKERIEQRREAKIQAKEKWVERDVLALMDSIDSLLKYVAIYRKAFRDVAKIRDRERAGVLTKSETFSEQKSLLMKIDETVDETNLKVSIALSQAHSFGDEISSDSGLSLDETR